MSLNPGDILLLRDEIKCQGLGIIITYGLDKGARVPVLVLPTECENMLPPEVRAAIDVLRKPRA